MISLHTLKDTTRTRKARKRVGRGIGSKHGKTCGRGEKGAGSRAGYKRRYGKEGGNMPLFMKLPIRGFSNVQFRREFDVINLDQIEAVFQDGETVNEQTLRDRGIISGKSHGVKLLGNGELKKKLKIQVQAISDGAREKLTRAKIAFEIAK
ncbi:50S ribosomal protein L15 [Candidatus Protochlamydia phocaeensis]|uniref:50S ribosomal protein L15 n=1 Tax=Candidatus Protochlamydia phocaeensis TaxID=1414722 RepID=UPI0008398D5A|nr:50S ribosomal protein L15 [Candidatus Protochlamydia phocaeensis]